MEHQEYTQEMLDLIPQPAFLVGQNRILKVNPAAAALLLAPETEIDALFSSGWEDYTLFQSGQLYVTLSVGGVSHSAVVLHHGDADLFLLDQNADLETFRFMSLLSMQLRQPLGRVMDSAGTLFRELEDLPEEADGQISRMNRGLMQLLRIVNNLSDMERYCVCSHMQMLDIRAMAEELAEKAAVLSATTGIRIHYEGPDQPLFCQADGEQLERAIWNLLSNAIKFTPSGGSIAFRLARRGNRLQLSIHDSGSGIAETVRTSLFRRYLRHPGIEDSRFGLGLGIAIVRLAAANHGGTVLVDQPEGAGTRVTMTLSLNQQGGTLCSPILRPDYAGGWDHGLLELSDCLPAELFEEI